MARAKLNNLLEQLVRLRGSDLHLRAEKSPTIRVDGRLQVLEHPPLSAALVRDLAGVFSPDRPGRTEKDTEEIDCGFEMNGRRFRANRFSQLGQPALVIRLIPQIPGTLEELGLPLAVASLCRRPHGLVLVTGPSGSGKTTTLAAMLERINLHQRRHILTIEDPVEFLHRDKNSLVTHREINTDTRSFRRAIRMALREDPDVVLVGEMRDRETVEATLHLAETGHLTLSTLHTNSACSTLHRIIGYFDGNRQTQVRSQLAMVLQGVICQQLIPRQDTRGQTLAAEVLIPDPAIRHLIRENKAHQIYSLIQTGGKVGMQTMNQALATLLVSGEISESDGVGRSPGPEELRELIRTGAGRPRRAVHP